MNRPLISVIVPVFNVERYLSKCIESVINQSYSNLEIILVNDGSTDNSAIICDEYGTKDSRIRVHHKNNGGLSDARNVGMDNATGEYLYFLDSDDYIDLNALSVLYQSILDTSSQMAIGRVIRFQENSIPLKNAESKLSVYNNLSAIRELYNFKNPDLISFIIACNKLYHRDLFRNVKFPKGRINEDEFINYIIFFRASKICLTTDALYFYLSRSNSIVNTISDFKLLDKITALRRREKFLKEIKAQDILLEVRYHLFLTFFSFLKNVNAKRRSEHKLIRLIEFNTFTMAFKLLGSCILFKRKIKVLLCLPSVIYKISKS
jgi:glycosyltransferase involved in cell wall biosynthesis